MWQFKYYSTDVGKISTVDFSVIAMQRYQVAKIIRLDTNIKFYGHVCVCVCSLHFAGSTYRLSHNQKEMLEWVIGNWTRPEIRTIHCLPGPDLTHRLYTGIPFNSGCLVLFSFLANQPPSSPCLSLPNPVLFPTTLTVCVENKPVFRNPHPPGRITG